MIDCPYKSYGCTYQAANHYDMEEHLLAMTGGAQEDPEHPFRGDPIKSFNEIRCTGDPAEEA